MCWMAIHTGDDALARALDGCRANEAARGGHSWGYAVTTADGRLETGHGLGRVPPHDPAVDGQVVAALGHTRYATRGDVTLANAHPFPVRDRAGDPVAALAHNGTWQDAPAGDRCDSYYIARVLEDHTRAHPDAPFRTLLDHVGQEVGETLTVLHRDGTAYAYSGRYGITQGEQWVRSTGGTPIPEGLVTTA